MKRFNVAGTCRHEEHYMVDISDRLQRLEKMICQGDYFCINRGRQYGKTTTLNALYRNLSDRYSIFFISFESYGDTEFATIESACTTALRAMYNATVFDESVGLSKECQQMLEENAQKKNICVEDFKLCISLMCKKNPRPIVLMIDEVDKAGNYLAFIQLLAVLRDLYLSRDRRPTFRSVILAGVYDIKNLKLKMRSEDGHQYNSPWNISVPYDEDMSLSAEGIADMLQEYKSDHHLSFDAVKMGQALRDYTDGYPFLVSRLSMLMDASGNWSDQGLLDAVKAILTESNTLFDDTKKKLADFPRLKQMLYNILFKGEDIPYNADLRDIEIAQMFSFVKNDQGKLRIVNRLFEMRLYNMFISEGLDQEVEFAHASSDKPLFFDGRRLNMERVLERFCHLYGNLYSARDEKFDESEGRKKFIFYVKPIINGTGNYYTESTTRNLRRTDLIIDYLGEQFIIEMKIWHGQKYNQEGETQLIDYLNAHNLEVGYMLTFNFNKKKKTGITKRKIEGKTIIEAVV